MFVTGFLHSGASIAMDFLHDVIPSYDLSGGDECYFMREKHGAIDKIYGDKTHSAARPLQLNLKFKLYLVKLLLTRRVGVKGCYERFAHNKKCKNYWKEIDRVEEYQDKLGVVKSFYSRNDSIYLNAISLDMPVSFLDYILELDTHIFPIRNIYAQLKDIEDCNYFFGPFDFNIEYILGRKDLAHIRRSAYLDVLSYRLMKLEQYKSHKNVLILDVDNLLQCEDYRRKIHKRLNVKYSINPYKKLNLTRQRPWLKFCEDVLLCDEKLSQLYGPNIEKVRKIQDQINKLKCG